MSWEDKVSYAVIALSVVWILIKTPKGKDIFYD